MATNRKPKSVANLLPIFYSQAFVFVRLWQLFFEGDEIFRGRILVFKTSVINRSTALLELDFRGNRRAPPFWFSPRSEH
jgi:hypothetical protein